MYLPPYVRMIHGNAFPSTPIERELFYRDDLHAWYIYNGAAWVGLGGLGTIGTKNPPIDADKELYLDSTAGDAPVTSTWTQIKAFLKTHFDTLYAPLVAAHNRLHSITSALDHSSTATPAKILKADANGLPVDATNTDAEVTDAVAKKHTQGTDVALGAVATKNPPIDADKVLYRDSTAGDALVTSTWTQAKAFLKTYFDPLYDAIGSAAAALAAAIAAIAAHAGLTTGVHGVGADTVAAVGDIAVDANLSVAAQDAITKRHTQGTDVALGVVGTKNPPIDADKVLYRDSTASDALVTSTWTQVKAFLKTYWDGLYEALGSVAAHAGLTAAHGATGAVVGTTNSQILTTKTLIATSNTVEEITTTTSSATPTPTGGSLRNFFTVTALAEAATFAPPSGTPANSNKLIIRIKDNGTARALSWNAIYRNMGATLPTTTVLSKTMYLALMYNSADSKWDCLAVNPEA